MYYELRSFYMKVRVTMTLGKQVLFSSDLDQVTY